MERFIIFIYLKKISFLFHFIEKRNGNNKDGPYEDNLGKLFAKFGNV